MPKLKKKSVFMKNAEKRYRLEQKRLAEKEKRKRDEREEESQKILSDVYGNYPIKRRKLSSEDQLVTQQSASHDVSCSASTTSVFGRPLVMPSTSKKTKVQAASQLNVTQQSVSHDVSYSASTTSVFGRPLVMPSTSKKTRVQAASQLNTNSTSGQISSSYIEEESSKVSLVSRKNEKVRKLMQLKRQNSTFCLQEQEREKLRKRLKRANPDVRDQANQAQRDRRKDPAVKDKEKLAKQNKRKDPAVKDKEKLAKQDKRKDPAVKDKEKLAKQNKRKDPAVKDKEKLAKQDKRKDPAVKERDKLYEQDKRKDPAVREKEKLAKQNKRKDPAVKDKEKLDKQDKRKDPAVKDKEKLAKQDKRKDPAVKERDKLYEQDKRKDPAVREKEKLAKQNKRKDPAVKDKEKLDKQDKRKDPAVKDKEKLAKQDKRKDPAVKERDKLYEQDKRKDPAVREKDKLDKQNKRKDPAVKDKEKLAKKDKRKDPAVREKEKLDKQEKRKQTKPQDFKELVLGFHKKVEEGPIYVCTCCKQLMYFNAVVNTEKATIKSQMADKLQELIGQCLTDTKSVQGKEWICRTCLNYLKKSKMPPSAIANKMQFPEQGPLKDLNPLESTLVSPLLPFMKIHQAPSGNQLKIRGNMVVVPSDTVNTVQTLPRCQSNTGTIKAKLKRRLRYDHHIYSLNIRPEKIREAAKYLAETGQLYKQLGIKYNLNWSTEDDSSAENNEESSNSLEKPEGTTAQEPNACQTTASIDSDEEWDEVDIYETMTGNADTFLTPPNFINDNEKDIVYSFAPAENRQPVSIFIEKTAEEQAFPTIFCGHARMSNDKRPVPVTYGEIIKSELRNSDRRCALTVENIFFKTKKLQMKYLIDQTTVALRKIQTGGQKLTAKDVRKENTQNLIHLDQGYKVLKTLRGSPPYFQAISKDLFAMISQLGPATFFLTLSAAETHWIHLLRILGKLIDKKDYTDEELNELTWQQKSRLIQADPVTCSRHFDYSLKCFINHFILSNLNPIGNVTDLFHRIEFQQRGSPHAHMMVWCTDCPKLTDSSHEDICIYIDRYITCKLPPEGTELANLVKFQTHKHTKTCKQKRKKKCRFGFPKPPMKKTKILEPLDDDETIDKAKYQSLWNTVHEQLTTMKDGEEISHDEFLEKISMNEDDYIMAIRSSLSTTTVFLKRSPKEIRVNSYNVHCLEAWRANMDLQFVIDVYACAVYIASYVTKSQRGMSELLSNACKEANTGNKTIKEQVRLIGNKFLNAVEISAQEACYLALQLPLKKSSRQTIFVNTSPPDKRVVLLKPQEQLTNMDDEDEEIECKNLLARYAERPNTLQNVTLAEFASLYEKKNTGFVSRAKKLCKTTRDGLLPETDPQQDTDMDSDDSTDEPANQEQNVEYRKRKKPKIIRTVHFNQNTDPENYYRELLMLYLPWRNENKDLIGEFPSFALRHAHFQKEIDEQRKVFEPFRSEVQSAESFIAEQPDLTDAWDTIAPNTQHRDNQDTTPPQLNNHPADQEYDIGPDLGLQVSTTEDINLYNELADKEYRKLMRSLNQQQIEFIYEIVHQIKTTEKPVYHFLSGGAGVGKSFVTKALYQTILKFFNRKAGADYTTPKILLMAPTGKAAYHIHGNTIHSTLRIPANQKMQHKALESSAFNTLQKTIGNVELIFIDEISMVGYKMFNCIHQRLMEIRRSKADFGGVSIIAIGDLFQLKPVMDSYIFKAPQSDYLPLATNLWESHFKMTELNIIMRQKDNKEFAELLNRLREGNQTDDDINKLKLNIIDPDDENYPYEIPHIFTSNANVNSHNSEIFLRSKSLKYTVAAKDRLIGHYNEDTSNKILQSFLSKSKDVPQLSSTVQLAENLMYELTINLDCLDGLINGASCKLKQIKLTDATMASGILWVQFFDENTGQLLRKAKSHLYKPGIDKTWTPLEPISRQYQAGYKGEAQIQRLQFPLRPSAAKTVHRSQGDTLDEIVVDLRSKIKIDHIHYVALSRVTSMAGLNIRCLQENKISVNAAVQQEMERLRSQDVEKTLKCLYLMPSKLRIVFLNVPSLTRHIEDIREDLNLSAADIVSFCETKLLPSDQDPLLPDFNCYRSDSRAPQGRRKTNSRSTATQQNNQAPSQQEIGRPTYGMAVYTKQHVHIKNQQQTNSKYQQNGMEIETILIEIEHAAQNIVLVFLYKPCKIQSKYLLEHLNTIYSQHLFGKQGIIMGDFNIDFSTLNADQSKLTKFFHNIGYQQFIKSPTTDNKTTIDLVFTNIPDSNIDSGVLEVFYSDHKPIWVAL